MNDETTGPLVDHMETRAHVLEDANTTRVAAAAAEKVTKWWMEYGWPIACHLVGLVIPAIRIIVRRTPSGCA
jgi:hypothetical protein